MTPKAVRCLSRASRCGLCGTYACHAPTCLACLSTPCKPCAWSSSHAPAALPLLSAWVVLADFEHPRLRPNTIGWLCGLSRGIAQRCTHEAEQAAHAGEASWSEAGHWEQSWLWHLRALLVGVGALVNQNVGRHGQMANNPERLSASSTADMHRRAAAWPADDLCPAGRAGKARRGASAGWQRAVAARPDVHARQAVCLKLPNLLQLAGRGVQPPTPAAAAVCCSLLDVELDFCGTAWRCFDITSASRSTLLLVLSAGPVYPCPVSCRHVVGCSRGHGCSVPITHSAAASCAAGWAPCRGEAAGGAAATNRQRPGHERGRCVPPAGPAVP